MKKRHIWKVLLGAFAVVAVVLVGIYFLLQNQTYNTVDTLEFYENVSTDNAGYVSCLGGILKYSRDGVSLLTREGEEVWNQSCQMSNPSVQIRENMIAVSDRGGTSILVFEKNGLKGEIKTTRPIEKAAVSGQGIVAAVLKDETTPLIMCYDAEGSPLVEQKTSLSNTGYPIDVAISEDGNMLLVSYLFTKGNSIVSKVVYYDFGGEDIDKKEYQVQEKEYEGIVIPATAFLDENTSLLIADDSIILYEGKEKPEEAVRVEVNEICNAAYNEKIIALVVKDSESSEYKLMVYNTKGKLVSETNVDKEYSGIKVCGKQIILYEGALCGIYTEKGVCKYEGKMDLDILEIFPLTGLNKYMMINANGFYEIRLAK
ncbi:MAG: hypothetical protein IJZ53_12885 [Tyzzerella sp.]|nr:hypothetical protein [Tyzzerella sp.]